MRRIIVFLLAALLLVSNSAYAAKDKKDLIDAEIVRVVDGDTMKVTIGKKEETIRLLIVDTPETKDPNKPIQPFGKEATAYAVKNLDGKSVKLELDVSERDRYGRLLVYLWIGDKLFNEMLLKNGLARVAVYQPNVKYVDQFRAAQKAAQKARINIWSVENYVQSDGFQSPKKKAKQPAAAKKPAGKNVTYKNCTAVREAGAAPLYKGDPGYSTKLDRDGDGVACEK